MLIKLMIIKRVAQLNPISFYVSQALKSSESSNTIQGNTLGLVTLGSEEISGRKEHKGYLLRG